jgi:DNA-binding CsgD family transcriptional regulator
MAQKMTVTERDLRTMLGIVGGSAGEEVADPLPRSVLVGLRELIPCDVVVITMFDVHRREFYLHQEVGNPSQVTEEQDAELEQVLWRIYWDSPHCRYPDETGDLSTVLLDTDFMSNRELHSTAAYCEYRKYWGDDEYEMGVFLPSQPGRVLRLIFYRGPGLDFSFRDRSLATLLRPHIYEAYREQQRRRRPRPQLTKRQEQLLRMVAAGYTNAQISRRLSISEATVRKHLENVFERLQVTSRTAAVTAYWAADDMDNPPGTP